MEAVQRGLRDFREEGDGVRLCEEREMRVVGRRDRGFVRNVKKGRVLSSFDMAAFFSVCLCASALKFR